MSINDLFKRRESLHNGGFLYDARKEHDYTWSKEFNNGRWFNNSMQQINHYSRTLNNNFSHDKSLRLHTSSSNQKSTPFVNYRIPDKHFNPSIYNPLNHNNIHHCKNQLVRAQSMNAIHSNQRIHMLTKINTLLENHSQPTNITHSNSQFTPQISQSQFHQQIHTKIDRLEGYLHKIKHQRNKQKTPTIKVQPQNIKTMENPQLPLQAKQQKIKIGISNVFNELDKLKMQIGRVRQQAIEVQKKNSLSRDKHLKNIQVEPNFTKIKQEIIKLKAINCKIKPQLLPKIKDDPQSNISPIQKFNEITQRIPQSNHTNSFQNLNHSNHHINHHVPHYLPSQSRQINETRTSKPKITFSFAAKK